MSIVAEYSEGAAPRGVWRAPYDQDNYPVFVAIDSHGRKVASVVVMRGINPSIVTRMLTEILDRVDPRVKLQLVADAIPDPF